MNDYIFECIECGAKFTRETDCLKHTYKYNHLTFTSPEGNDYQPLKDKYLIE